MQLSAAILILSAVTMQTEAPSRAEIDARFQTQLSELAAKCDEVKLPEQAELTRTWIVPRYGQANLFYLVPESDPLQPDDNASQLVQFWYQKFRTIRNAHADALYKHAQELLIAKQGARSYQTLHEVLRENPDHADARRILGYANVNGTWRRPGVVTRAKQPRYQHPKFDWPARSFWQIDTPHFQIMTNLSEAEGLKLGERLEIVYSAWEQMFFSYWSNELQLAGYFDGGSPSPVRKKLEVVLFKTRGEYVSYLEQVQPRIGITLGIYQFDEEKVYLFHDESEAAHATWHHEVSHQLFQEYRSASKEVGLNFNFWAIEGVAMYMESLRIFDGYVTLGGVDASRLQFARNRYFTGGFHLPIEELAGMSRDDLQKSPDIGAIYSQSAGVAQMFLDYPPSATQWREPFIDYLKEIYLGRDRAHSLNETVKDSSAVGYDGVYREFLTVSDQDILALPESAPTTDLVLATMDGITDAALSRIGTFEKLRWLDLTKTEITDSGVAHLTRCRSLRDLSIATTRISNDSLATVGKLSTLEELDISGTPVTDAGLAHLRGLSKLKVLRLAVTQVGDEGLLQLARLKNLEMIDARQTQVTPQGIERLKQSLPKVVVHH
ncbi:hypothetical protein [Bremerella sp. P1]|uniref:hypothetical protein n=1 Tax=Bremerella sp. P1 TaxID=3026424 RepID=UPI002368314B|nr:hypothetical protein [Bremerella sp. P1]WDI44139.1 hypothetical protein PSR63_09355 [Bremerella sp. P1]